MGKLGKISLISLGISLALLVVSIICGVIYQAHNGVISASNNSGALWMVDVTILLFGIVVLSMISAVASLFYEK